MDTRVRDQCQFPRHIRESCLLPLKLPFLSACSPVPSGQQDSSEGQQGQAHLDECVGFLSQKGWKALERTWVSVLKH